MLDRSGRLLDPLANAQLSERSPCVVHGAMQDLLDCTQTLGVQALLRLHWPKMHERITDKLLLLRRHEPSIQYLGISPAALIIFVPSRCETSPFLQ
jgi:hypothetical protein